jgi:hypothetical protein
MFELILVRLMTIASRDIRPSDNVKQVCAIGLAALNDLSIIDREPNTEAFFDGRTFSGRRVLFEVCPELQPLITKRYKLAGEADQRIANSKLGPIRTIFTLGVPQINPDLTHATVTMGYRCGSMCGAGYEVVYVRQNDVWTRKGPPRLIVLT